MNKKRNFPHFSSHNLTPIIGDKLHIIGPETEGATPAFVETCVIGREDFQVKCKETNDLARVAATVTFTTQNEFDHCI